MRTLELFEQLGINFVPPNQQRRRGACETSCVRIVDRMIRKFGAPHTTFVLRTITKTENNATELIADAIHAVSDVVRAHPRWEDCGLDWLAAFDKISLADIRKTAKAAAVQPLRVGIATLICIELEKILGPSRLPKAKPVRVKKERKLPRAETRIPEVQRNLQLGVELLALRATIKSNAAFGRAVRARYDVPAADVSEAMQVTRLYAGRDEIVNRLSWAALVRLSSPSMPASVRQDLEDKIAAGYRISCRNIERARGTLKPGRPRRPADPPAMRIAA